MLILMWSVISFRFHPVVKNCQNRPPSSVCVYVGIQIEPAQCGVNKTVYKQGYKLSNMVIYHSTVQNVKQIPLNEIILLNVPSQSVVYPNVLQ